MYNCSLDDYTTCFTFGQTTTTNVPHRFCFANCCPSAAPTASPILSVAPPDTTPLPLQSTPTTTVAPHPPAATGYNFQMDNLMKNISSAPPMFRGINFDENLCRWEFRRTEWVINLFVFFIDMDFLQRQQVYLRCLDFIKLQLNMRVRCHHIELNRTKRNKGMQRCVRESVPAQIRMKRKVAE